MAVAEESRVAPPEWDYNCRIESREISANCTTTAPLEEASARRENKTRVALRVALGFPQHTLNTFVAH